MLGIELRASHTQDRCPAIELLPQTPPTPASSSKVLTELCNDELDYH